MKKDITELYCCVEDFCRAVDDNFANRLLSNGKKPTRVPEIAHSEILTIILLYHQSPCKNFKAFYLLYLPLYKSEFPKLPTYDRFIALKSRILWYLALLLQWFCEQAKMTGISYIDTSTIAVCHKKRISRNKVFDGLAEISKSTYGWFLGFKLHLVINEIGEIQALTLTRGNVDDRKPVPILTKKLTGLLFGDKGYIKKELFEKLFDRGLKLVTKVKKGMKNTLISLKEKILLGSVDKILEKPYKSSNKIEKTHKNLSSLVKSRKNAPKVLDFSKEAFNQMTFFVDMLIVIPLYFSIPFWWNNYYTSLAFKTCNKSITIVAFISHYSRVIDIFG